MPVDVSDPVAAASASSTSANIKTFGHYPDVVIDTLMNDVLNSARDGQAYSRAITTRCIDMIAGKSEESAGNAALLQIAQKAAVTTPPVYSDPVNYTNLANIVASTVTQAISASMAPIVAALQSPAAK